MKTFSQKSLWTTVILLALTATAAIAFGGGGPGMRGQGPPQAAFDACDGKQPGDSVTFQSRRGFSVDATCQQVNDRLMAVPQQWGGGRGYGPGNCNGPRGGQGPMAGGFGPRMAAELNLTADQRQQIETIRNAQFTKNQAVRTEMWQKRSAMRELMLAEEYDEAAVRQLIEQQNALRTTMILSRVQMKREIFALLTPEQQQKAREWINQRGAGRGLGGGQQGMRW